MSQSLITSLHQTRMSSANWLIALLATTMWLQIDTKTVSEIHNFESNGHISRDNNATITSSPIYTKWSSWSRCHNCLHRRIKECITPKCGNSRIYEEKPCNRRRCKKRRLLKHQFHVLHLNEATSMTTRQAPSRIWSKWSSWSPCSEICRTQRIRICRKPGRCKKRQQEQTAYCYHDNSRCQIYVLSLLDSDIHNANNIYEYSNEDEIEHDGRRRAGKKTHSDNIIKNCGAPHRKWKMLKIIGGRESEKSQWPWHVAILNRYMEVFCGGTLIASRWVLTASHCIRPFLRVRLNEHDLRAHDGREMEMTIRKIFQHPRFNAKTVDNDIALLQLPRPVHLPVACLPHGKAAIGEMCTVMGWGKVRVSDTYGVNKLHETQLPVVAPHICKKSYRHFLITDNMLCAGWQSGKSDTCAGDSGGGLMCPVKGYQLRDKPYSVQGITSFGDGCGLRNKYGIYTVVYNYLKWINYIMDHYS